jgi:hypothetical protein
MSRPLPALPAEADGHAWLPSLDAVDALDAEGLVGVLPTVAGLAEALVRAEAVNDDTWRQSITGHLRQAVDHLDALQAGRTDHGHLREGATRLLMQLATDEGNR